MRISDWSSDVCSSDLLDIDGIEVGYPAPGGLRVVVDALSLALDEGAIVCLLGASGCCKTTVLRAVAGFEPVQAGRIDVQGRRVASAGFSLPPAQRSVGMMFQDYSLFPHLEVNDHRSEEHPSEPTSLKRI